MRIRRQLQNSLNVEEIETDLTEHLYYKLGKSTEEDMVKGNQALVGGLRRNIC